MLSDVYIKYKRLIWVSGIILVLLIVGWVIYDNVVVFRITTITPNPNGASYLSPKLVVDFNKDLATNNVAVTFNGSPATTLVKGKELTIELTDMDGNKAYDVTINSIKSTSGDVITNNTIVLHTALNSDSLSASDLQENLAKQVAGKSPILDDPILAYVPHSTLDYTITDQINNADTSLQSITVTIDVLLSEADVNIDRNGAIQQYQQEAMSYLQSLKGVDLTKYNIETTVTDPS